MRRKEILDLLEELARRLDARGVSGEMYVVGGAAIALAFDERRSTRDVDAVFEPTLVIYETAAELERERGLPSGGSTTPSRGFSPRTTRMPSVFWTFQDCGSPWARRACCSP